MEPTFWHHLSELRRCLIRTALYLMLGFLLSLFLSRELLQQIIAPAGELVFLRPAEAFMAQLKVAFLNGIVISFPLVLWQLGQFIIPALYPNERKYLFLMMPFAFLLFMFGIVFGYFVVVRLGYKFLLDFGQELIKPMISLDAYLSFVLSSMLACGLIFLLPVVIIFLARVRIITAQMLWRQQKLIIIMLMILVAILTPTVDIISMLLVFLPLLLLFEFSVFLAYLGERKSRRKIKEQDSSC